MFRKIISFLYFVRPPPYEEFESSWLIFKPTRAVLKPITSIVYDIQSNDQPRPFARFHSCLPGISNAYN